MNMIKKGVLGVHYYAMHGWTKKAIMANFDKVYRRILHGDWTLMEP
jgi:hypothetical protein